MSDPSINPDGLSRLVNEFIRYLLGRGDKSVDKACEEWIPAHLFGKGSAAHALAFQTYTICDLVNMYELAGRASVIACASLIYEKHPALGREMAAVMAAKMITDAAERVNRLDRAESEESKPDDPNQ